MWVESIATVGSWPASKPRLVPCYTSLSDFAGEEREPFSRSTAPSTTAPATRARVRRPAPYFDYYVLRVLRAACSLPDGSLDHRIRKNKDRMGESRHYAVCRLRGRVAARGAGGVASVESDVEAGAVPLPLPVEECALPR